MLEYNKQKLDLRKYLLTITKFILVYELVHDVVNVRKQPYSNIAKLFPERMTFSCSDLENPFAPTTTASLLPQDGSSSTNFVFKKWSWISLCRIMCAVLPFPEKETQIIQLVKNKELVSFNIFFSVLHRCNLLHVQMALTFRDASAIV
jgi:hypothetical protein